MQISEFFERYTGIEVSRISELCCTWQKEEPSRISNASTAAVVLADLISGDGTLDHISPELLTAFSSLFGRQVDTADEVRSMLFEKLSAGDTAVQGLVNQIKGRIGELEFQRASQEAGLSARLAEKVNQEAWDVAVEHGNGFTQYIQVKTRADADSVVRDLREVNSRLAQGTVIDGERLVTQVDVAVPAEIAKEVSRKLENFDIAATVYNMNMTASEAAEVVEEGIQYVGPGAIAHLFKELSDSAVSVAVLLGVANAFLIYKESKDFTKYLYTTTEETTVSTESILGGMSVELILTKISLLGGLPTYALVFGTTIATRRFLERIARRGDYAERISVVNIHLRELIAGTESA